MKIRPFQHDHFPLTPEATLVGDLSGTSVQFPNYEIAIATARLFLKRAVQFATKERIRFGTWNQTLLSYEVSDHSNHACTLIQIHTSFRILANPSDQFVFAHIYLDGGKEDKSFLWEPGIYCSYMAINPGFKPVPGKMWCDELSQNIHLSQVNKNENMNTQRFFTALETVQTR